MSALRQTVEVRDHRNKVIGEGYCYYLGRHYNYDLFGKDGLPLSPAQYDIRVTGELEIVVMPKNIQ